MFWTLLVVFERLKIFHEGVQKFWDFSNRSAPFVCVKASRQRGSIRPKSQVLSTATFVYGPTDGRACLHVVYTPTLSLFSDLLLLFFLVIKKKVVYSPIDSRARLHVVDAPPRRIRPQRWLNSFLFPPTLEFMIRGP